MGYKTTDEYDPYDREYDNMHPSTAYDNSTDYQYQSSMDHFLYNRGMGDDD